MAVVLLHVFFFPMYAKYSVSMPGVHVAYAVLLVASTF
jgi:hypothetical protein